MIAGEGIDQNLELFLPAAGKSRADPSSHVSRSLRAEAARDFDSSDDEALENVFPPLPLLERSLVRRDGSGAFESPQSNSLPSWNGKRLRSEPRGVRQTRVQVTPFQSNWVCEIEVHRQEYLLGFHLLAGLVCEADMVEFTCNLSVHHIIFAGGICND